LAGAKEQIQGARTGGFEVIVHLVIPKGNSCVGDRGMGFSPILQVGSGDSRLDENFSLLWHSTSLVRTLQKGLYLDILKVII